MFHSWADLYPRTIYERPFGSLGPVSLVLLGGSCDLRRCWCGVLICQQESLASSQVALKTVWCSRAELAFSVDEHRWAKKSHLKRIAQSRCAGHTGSESLCRPNCPCNFSLTGQWCWHHCCPGFTTINRQKQKTSDGERDEWCMIGWVSHGGAEAPNLLRSWGGLSPRESPERQLDETTRDSWAIQTWSIHSKWWMCTCGNGDSLG